MTVVRSLPMCLIVLPLEGAPKVVYDATSDSEMRRLSDWIREHPRIARLIADALDEEVTGL